MPSLNTKLASAPNTSSNYVLKATSSTTIGNSLIQDDGTNVAIGTTPGTYKLNVSGTFNATGAATFSSSVTATEGIFSSGGVDGSLGAVVRIYSTNTNGNSRNWALVNTFENYGDLNFRLSTAQGGNPLTAGSTIMTLNRSGYLGLATNNPTAKIHIEGQNWTTGSLSDCWNAPFFKLTPRPALTTSSIVMTNAGTSANMAFQALSGTTTAEILSLNPYGGNVGTGTTSPNTHFQVKTNVWSFFAEKQHGSNANFCSINFNGATGSAIIQIANSSYKPGQDTYAGCLTIFVYTTNGTTINVNTISTYGTSYIGTSISSGVLYLYFSYAGPTTNYSNASVTINGTGNQNTNAPLTVTMI